MEEEKTQILVRSEEILKELEGLDTEAQIRLLKLLVEIYAYYSKVHAAFLIGAFNLLKEANQRDESDFFSFVRRLIREIQNLLEQYKRQVKDHFRPGRIHRIRSRIAVVTYDRAVELPLFGRIVSRRNRPLDLRVIRNMRLLTPSFRNSTLRTIRTLQLMLRELDYFAKGKALSESRIIEAAQNLGPVDFDGSMQVNNRVGEIIQVSKRLIEYAARVIGSEGEVPQTSLQPSLEKIRRFLDDAYIRELTNKLNALLQGGFIQTMALDRQTTVDVILAIYFTILNIYLKLAYVIHKEIEDVYNSTFEMLEELYRGQIPDEVMQIVEADIESKTGSK